MANATYVKIGDEQFVASISGLTKDSNWDGRQSKSIVVEMDYSKAVELFVNNVTWYIVYIPSPYVDPETGETITPETEVYDNSEYSVAGPITDHRDGTITVKMGKPTEVETLHSQLANAVTEEELEAAYVEGVNSL